MVDRVACEVVVLESQEPRLQNALSPDNCFDTVTCTLSLCTIPDDLAAIGEIHGVLRPRGRLILMEHVRSPTLPVRDGRRVTARPSGVLLTSRPIAPTPNTMATTTFLRTLE